MGDSTLPPALDARAPTVVVLDGAADPGAIGGKAAAIDRLVAADQPVPRAAAVTTAGYRAVEADPSVRALIARLRHADDRSPTAGLPTDEEVDGVFLEAALPTAIRTSIASITDRLRPPLAVRSSATAEDSATAAFPGQHRTLLDVPADGLERAVRLVWASLWHGAPRAYRASQGIADGEPTMAVLVMEMIEAARAGVLFTRDPVGDEADIRLETVEGCGDALVSGVTTPTAHRWPRTSAVEDAAEAIGPAAAELVERSLALETILGGPQDIEFAIDGKGRLWLLQARPITTLGRSSLTRAGIAEMLPGILPPLLRDTAGNQIDEGFRRLVADLGGSVPDGAFVRFVHGRAWLDLDTLRRSTATIPGASIAELERGYGIEPVAPARSPRPTAAQTLRVLRRRRSAVLEAEIVTQAIDLLGDAAGDDRERLDDRSLLARWERVEDLGRRTAAAEMSIATLANAAHRGVERTVARHLADPAAVNRAVHELTRSGDAAAGAWVRRIGNLPRPPEHADVDEWARAAELLARDPNGRRFRTAWDAALARSGSRSIFGGPTWQADPELAWLALRSTGDLASGADASATVLQRPRVPGRLVPGLSRARRRFLRREAADAAALIARRERTKQALLDLGGSAHRLVSEIGRRLDERGIVTAADDVWLLTRDEVHRALITGRAPDLADRRHELDEDRRRTASTDAPTTPGSGWGASAGRVTGRARVVTEPRAGAIDRGDVLVARNTDAGWAPLFAVAGGIVVEEGGPLSHAAILARELGVPAVVNVPGIVAAVAAAGERAEIDLDGTTGRVVVSEGAVIGPPIAPVLIPPDQEQRVGVFVTGLIGASAMLGAAVSVTEAVSSARSVRRTHARAAAPAAAVAAMATEGPAAPRRTTDGLVAARRYGVLGSFLATLALIVAGVGVGRYASNDHGDRVLGLAGTLSATMALAAVAGLCLVAWRSWPDVPAVVRRLTPPRRERASIRDLWVALPDLHRRAIAVLMSVAVLLLVLNLVAADRLRQLDERIYDAIGAGPSNEPWGPEWFGMYFGRPQVAIPVALAVALFTVRCRVLALAYPLTIMFGGVLNLGLGLAVGRARPPLGAHADQTDSFPSGHAIEVTLLLGLAPLAIAVLFRSRLLGAIARGLASGVLVVMLLDGLREGSHWPTDHLAGFAIAMSAVVFVHALARTPTLHGSCRQCPALSVTHRPGMKRGVP